MKLVIAGSRSVLGYKTVDLAVRKNYDNDSPPYRWDVEIVHGGARGVDTCASTFAEEYELEEVVFEPEWDEHGKAAGPIRNREMAEYGDILIAVWDGESNGTRSMIDEALDHGLEVHVELVR